LGESPELSLDDPGNGSSYLGERRLLSSGEVRGRDSIKKEKLSSALRGRENSPGRTDVLLV